MPNLKLSTKFIIINQIIIAIFQIISVIVCFLDNDRVVRFFCCFTFICFVLTVIIDIILKYDFAKKQIIRIFLISILLSLSTFSQGIAFYVGIPFCTFGCTARHPLNALHGIMVVVMIVYIIAYFFITIFLESKSNQQINQLNNPQLVNTLNYNDNAIYNNNDNLLTPQNTENITTTTNQI